jgi:hypothetical protein
MAGALGSNAVVWEVVPPLVVVVVVVVVVVCGAAALLGSVALVAKGPGFGLAGVGA